MSFDLFCFFSKGSVAFGVLLQKKKKKKASSDGDEEEDLRAEEQSDCSLEYDG